MNFREMLSIDQHHLDYELLRQPTLVQLVSEELVRAETKRARSKELVEIVKAELYTEIRNNPARFNLNDRVTETAVNAAILQHPRYREAMETYLSAKEDHGILSTGLDALQHKKSALENCVRLLLSGYWAAPHVPRESLDVLNTGQTTLSSADQVTTSLTENLNRDLTLRRRFNR